MRKGKRRSNGVRQWQTRLHLSTQAMEGDLEEARRNTAFYIGHAMDRDACANEWEWDSVRKMLAGGDYLNINRILATLASQNSAILWRNPWHRLRARRYMGSSENVEIARHVTEHTLNFCLQHPKNNWLLNSRLLVLSAELGTGIIKATYAPHEGLNPETNKREEYGEIIALPQDDGTVLKAFTAGMPKMGPDGSPIMRRGNKYVVDTRNPADYWRSEWKSVFVMRFDPEGGNNPERHSWIAERRVWKWNDIKDNPLFSDSKSQIKEVVRFIDEEGLSAHTRGMLGGHEEEVSGGSGDFDPREIDMDLMRVWGWQAWDYERREITYLIDGLEKEAAVVEYPKYIDTSPYTICKIHENPGVFAPITEVSQVRGISRAYNFTQTMHFRHAQRAGRLILAKKGMFDPKDEARIGDKDDMRVAYYKQGYSIMDTQPFQDPQLDPNTFILGSRLRGDFDEVMGSSAQSRSVNEGDTATEAAIVDNWTRSRSNDKRINIKESLEDHAGKYLNMMKATADEPMLVQINGPDGQLFNRVVHPANMQGDWTTEITLDELEPHDSRLEKAEYREVVATTGMLAFASKAFSRRFWRSHRSFDEQLVDEFHAIGQAMLDQQMKPAPQDGGEKVDGTGPEEGRTSEARSSGRKLSAVQGGKRGGA